MIVPDTSALLAKLNANPDLSDIEKAFLREQLTAKKKYGLIWEDKPEAVEQELLTGLPILTEVPEYRVVGVAKQVSSGVVSSNSTSGPPATSAQSTLSKAVAQPELAFGAEDAGNDPAYIDSIPAASPADLSGNSLSSVSPICHTLIEGDNLHALTVLNNTHAGQVDVIYIDPPYNTGNKDFKYNDSFVDREDSYRHSKWLSFMAKRLRLAKTLLKDTGVIFISIDDNEQAQLKLLCDEIFGEENAIGPIIQDKQNAKNDTINVQKNHEYILIYKKTVIKVNAKVVPSLINIDLNSKPVCLEEGEYYYLNDPITTRGDGGTLNKRANLGHTIYYNPITKDKKAVCDYNVELAKTSNDENGIYFTDQTLVNQGYVVIRPPKVRGKLGCWTWSLNKFNQEKKDLVITGKDGSYAVRKRTFIDKEKVFEEGGKLFYGNQATRNSRSILAYSTNDGTEQLSDVLGVAGEFNNPKNLKMLKYFIRLVPNPNALVLDFFAGSGTTMHAVMALNAEDRAFS